MDTVKPALYLKACIKLPASFLFSFYFYALNQLSHVVRRSQGVYFTFTITPHRDTERLLSSPFTLVPHTHTHEASGSMSVKCKRRRNSSYHFHFRMCSMNQVSSGSSFNSRSPVSINRCAREARNFNSSENDTSGINKFHLIVA